MINIRSYKDSDYGIVKNWWEIQTGEFCPENNYCSDASYILEYNGQMVACVSLLLTNSKSFSYFNALISNPEFQYNRKELISYFLTSLENIAKDKGYNKVILFAENDNLINYYSNKGYIRNKDLTCLYKELA